MLCPICKKRVEEPSGTSPPAQEKSYYPFCSERCKLIDLGRWLGGRYQIPVAPEDSDESDPPAAPRGDSET